jgi:NTE family protein
VRVKHGPKGSKVAIVCGGGGITGGVFEVGALRALDEALGGDAVNHADVYAGASAGALVATLLAAGLPPQDMDQVIVSGARNRLKLPALKRTSVYGIDMAGWALALGRLPVAMSTGFLRSLLPGETTGAADAMYEALTCLPAGVFSNEPLARFVEEGLRKLNKPLSFEEFGKELLITAVNLDTGHRVVFGAKGSRNISIPQAIRASAAVPMLFTPVRIDGQDYIDGGVERNLPVDAAVEAGASLVIAVNPMVPIVNDSRTGGSLGTDFRYLRDQGLPLVADQVFRLLIRSQVVYGLRQVRQQHPEVDIVVIEPEAHDWTFFRNHPMRYSVRQELARHAYDRTRQRLLRDSETLTRLFDKHGLDFDPRRLGERKARRASDTGRLGWMRGLEMVPGLGRLLGGDSGPEPF